MSQMDGAVSAWPENVPHQSNRHGAWGRRRLALALASCLIALALIFFMGRLCAADAIAVDFSSKNLAPSLKHPFGTDWMGRDMLARTLAGLSLSIGVGVVSAVLSSLIAVVLAAACVLGGRRMDAAVSIVTDVVLGIPHILLLILISYALGRGMLGVAVGVAVTHWPSLARVLRLEMRQCMDRPYVRIARTLGVGWGGILWRHLIPAVLPQLFVGLALTFPHAILHEASITFLGFGLSVDQPAIGVILSEAMRYLSAGAWWLCVFPGAALIIVVLLFRAVAACARRVTDPVTVQE